MALVHALFDALAVWEGGGGSLGASIGGAAHVPAWRAAWGDDGRDGRADVCAEVNADVNADVGGVHVRGEASADDDTDAHAAAPADDVTRQEARPSLLRRGWRGASVPADADDDAAAPAASLPKPALGLARR